MAHGTQSLQSRLTPGLPAEGAASVSIILIPFSQGIGFIRHSQSWLPFLCMCRCDYLTLARKFTKVMDAHPGALGQKLVLRVGWSCIPKSRVYPYGLFALGCPVCTACKEFLELCTWLPKSRGSCRRIEDEPQRTRLKYCWCYRGRGAVDPDSSDPGRA